MSRCVRADPNLSGSVFVGANTVRDVFDASLEVGSHALTKFRAGYPPALRADIVIDIELLLKPHGLARGRRGCSGARTLRGKSLQSIRTRGCSWAFDLLKSERILEWISPGPAAQGGVDVPWRTATSSGRLLAKG
jgi:hypothetical protein